MALTKINKEETLLNAKARGLDGSTKTSGSSINADGTGKNDIKLTPPELTTTEDVQTVSSTPIDSLLQKTKKGLGPYQIFLLVILPLIRGTYILNKNSIGYCFGFQGEGAQATA